MEGGLAMSTSPASSASPTLDHVLAQLKGVRTSLRGWRACCPAHADSEPSLSIGLGEQGQVLLKCFAGCSLEHIVEAMGLTILDLFPDGATFAEQGSSNGVHHQALTLLDLSLKKQLPWQYLFHLGVMDHASGGVQIPYHLADGQVAPRYRIRTALVAKEGSRWNSGEGGIVPYGLERLEEARKAGYLVLVEGESDCWTLWDLPPVRWAVPEILPEGLTLLAGKPKLGKSWLALSLALSIAAGGVALGKQPLPQGDVLYLALEENARRLQARARQLLASMTEVP